MSARLTYAASCARLVELGLLDDAAIPMPTRMPSFDDQEPLGFSAFREYLDDAVDLSNLTLDRTLIGRSELDCVSLQNTSLTEARVNWNDMAHVDLTDANLSRSDLRANQFVNVNFSNANLTATDFRHSSFDNCIFAGATMEGAVVTHAQGQTIDISARQRAVIAWCDNGGPEPAGG